MSGITLTLVTEPEFELDASTLIPGNLLDQPVDTIKALRLNHGRRVITLGELFEVSTNSDDVVRLENTSPRLHHVGQEMSEGHIEVIGSVGDRAGANMRGGTLRISGNAGDFVGSGMRGGLIDIAGDAGDFAGGALPGTMLGLRDGVIRIGGNAGDRIGDRMRRGVVVINGNAGSYCGSNMIAGTVIVTGHCDAGVALGMRRGTVVLARTPTSLPATFNPCGEYSLAMLQLLRRYIAGFDQKAARRLGRIKRVQRFTGDLGAGGQGEILIAQD